jgi:hypothetical protein
LQAAHTSLSAKHQYVEQHRSNPTNLALTTARFGLLHFLESAGSFSTLLPRRRRREKNRSAQPRSRAPL